MQAYTHIKHGFEPVFDERSEILILGSLPSVKSRENHFYYGHPQNRFWRMLAAVYREPVPETIAEKVDFLHRNRIALWDVIDECDIIGSSDSSIRNVIPADLDRILGQAPIRRILANGTAAYRLYCLHLYEKTKREICRMPSTSPANAACSLEQLIAAWSAQLKTN